MKFLPPQTQVCSKCLSPLFQNLETILFSTLLRCTHFFEEYLNPPGQDQQNGKEISVDYTLILQDLPQVNILSYFYRPRRALSLPQIFNFLRNLYMPPWLAKNVKFLVFRLPENAFASKKLNLDIFYHANPKVLIIIPKAEGNYSSPQAAFFNNLFLPAETGGRDYDC